MSDVEKHEGGCACGEVRYKTSAYPTHTAVCHCRYCQLRTGSAFGVSVYFERNAVEKLSGKLHKFEYETESGNKVCTEFCVICGTTVYWYAEAFHGTVGIGGGTFDPPSFWYDIKREVFCRSKAPFSENAINDKYQTSPIYNQVKVDPYRQSGSG